MRGLVACEQALCLGKNSEEREGKGGGAFPFFPHPARLKACSQARGLEISKLSGGGCPRPPLSRGLPSAAPFHRTASAKKKLDPPQQGMFTGVIYFDLKKAFDTLDKGLCNNYHEGGP